ncbi:MAG: alpha/beta hydrolase [Solirubrobacterales bacterium]
MTIALAILAVVVVGVIVANLWLGRLPRKPPMPGSTVSVQGRDLHYVERPGDGPVAVFIHGMPGLAEDWARVFAVLAPGIRALAFDRPGYGYSSGSPLSFDDQVDLVHEALAELGVENALFVGHSYGAVFSLRMALRHPAAIDALVLTAPAAGGTRLLPERLKLARIVRRLQRPVIRQLADLFFLRYVRSVAARAGAIGAYGTSPELADARHRAESVLSRHNSIAALMNDRLEFNDVNRALTPQLGEIAVSVTIIHGARDASVPLRNGRRVQAALPNARLIEVADATHILPETHPAKVADTVSEALARLQ